MKKILLIAGLALILNACETDFLDTRTDSDITTGNYYNNEPAFELALIGVYQSLVSADDQRGNYSMGVPIIGQAGTDECRPHPTNGNNPGRARLLDEYYLLSGSSEFLQSFYEVAYNGIMRCNELLKHAPAMEPMSDRMKEICAEARFVQALWYFDLVRTFGGVPLVTPEGDMFGTEYGELSRSSIEEVFKYLIAQLELAVVDMPTEYYSGNHGRANKMAGYALLAKAHLHVASSMRHLVPKMNTMNQSIKMGGINAYDWLAEVEGTELSREQSIEYHYRRAKECAKIVLDNFDASGTGNDILIPEFTDVFSPNESSKEVLFEAVFSGDLSMNMGGYPGGLYGPSGTASYGAGQAILYTMVGVTPNIFTFKFVDGNWYSPDKRFLWSISTYRLTAPGGVQTLVPNTQGNITNYFNLGKFRKGDGNNITASNTPINFPILRTSDVCLIYAEATAELDNAISDEALKYLNVVRRRAGITEYTTTSILETVPFYSYPFTPASNYTPQPGWESGPPMGTTVDDMSKQGNKPLLGYYRVDMMPMELFRQAILQERLMELHGEGHRWYDLNRMGILLEVANESAKAQRYVTNTALNRNMQDFHIFRPLPASEISLHRGNLKQNFGYTM